MYFAIWYAILLAATTATDKSYAAPLNTSDSANGTAAVVMFVHKTHSHYIVDITR